MQHHGVEVFLVLHQIYNDSSNFSPKPKVGSTNADVHDMKEKIYGFCKLVSYPEFC